MKKILKIMTKEKVFLSSFVILFIPEIKRTAKRERNQVRKLEKKNNRKRKI